MKKSNMIGIALTAHEQEKSLIAERERERVQKSREKMGEILTKIFETLKGPVPRTTGDVFKLGKIDLAMDRAGNKLHVVKDCPHCKYRVYGPAIYSLASIGKALTGEWSWDSHYCPEKDKSEHKTPAEQALNLLSELFEIVGPILPQ